MEVKFDLVRIGKIRKNYNSENKLKQNVDLLKSNICHLVKDEKCSHKNNRIDMTMIIPAKGYSIKIRLQDIKDFHLKKLIRENLPNSLYKGKLDTILDNKDNRVFNRTSKNYR